MLTPVDSGTSEVFVLSDARPLDAPVVQRKPKPSVTKHVNKQDSFPKILTAPIPESKRPPFAFLLCCDMCQAEPACVMSFNDRQLLCKSCDVSVHSGKSELEAPRFQVNAKCLPRLQAAAPTVARLAHRKSCTAPSSHPTTCSPRPTALLEADDLLMDLPDEAQAAPDGQLIDLDWWPGSSLGPTERQASNRQLLPLAYVPIDAALVGKNTPANDVGVDHLALHFSGAYGMEVPQSPKSQDSDSSGHSSCCPRMDSICRAHHHPHQAALHQQHGSLPPFRSSVPVAACGPSAIDTYVRTCVHCGVTKTPQWRAGPLGQKTLCNACGVRFKAGRLTPVVSYPPPGYNNNFMRTATAAPMTSVKRAEKSPGAGKRKPSGAVVGAHPHTPSPKKGKPVALVTRFGASFSG